MKHGILRRKKSYIVLIAIFATIFVVLGFDFEATKKTEEIIIPKEKIEYR